MIHNIPEHFKFHFGGPSIPPPTKLPAPPSKDTAAQNLLQQGMKKPPIGFDDTIIGNNRGPNTSMRKTLLGE